MYRAKRLAVTIAVFCFLAVGIASADTIIVNLGICNESLCSALGGVTTPYGTVTKTLVDNEDQPVLSGTGNIYVVVALSPGFTLIQHGIGFNYDGSYSSNGQSTLSASNITYISSVNYTFQDYTGASGGGAQFDGFGRFQYGFTGPNVGSANAVPALEFRIAGSFTSVEAIDVANPAGYEWAAHAAYASAAGAVTTGFISDGMGVPEPASLLLIGLGLIVFGSIHSRLRTR